MAQAWLFLNLDKRQKLWPYCGTRMGELFFSEYPTSIIKLLAIPEAASAEDLSMGRDVVSWAGDHIICIGDYTREWPDSILNSDDCNFLESPRFLYSNSIRITRRNVPNVPTYSGFNVLRNLTKKIYVRAEGIPAVSSAPGSQDLCFFTEPHPIDCFPGLGSVLLGRVAWSEDPSASMAWDEVEVLVTGEWAGDRFDVSSYDEVREELTSGDWIDAKDDEATRTSASIWQADGA